MSKYGTPLYVESSAYSGFSLSRFNCVL